jgi:aromatic ring hydroxylase
MAIRNGSQYRESLNDGRTVWYGDKELAVVDVKEFAGSIDGLAGYFDWQIEHADDCIAIDPVTGDQMAASLIVPRSLADLEARHRCYESIARYSCGSLGRSPDYINGTLAGFVAREDVFRNSEDPTSADRLLSFYREVVEGDLALTHTIIHPSVDRSIGGVAGMNADLALKVVRRTPTSIIVSGAKVLATCGPFCDEMFVYPGGEPLPADARDYALMFSIPVNTKGLIQVARDHYGVAAPIADAPFSSRFDEQDTFLIFDEVEIPLERVFINGDVETHNNLVKSGWAANIQHQTTTRAAVKLEFAYQLGAAMANAMNISKRPDVAANLGEILTFSRLTRAATKAAEANARDFGNGAFFPDEKPTNALRSSMSEWMVRTQEILIQLGSHNLLATPTQKAFENPKMAGLLNRYMPGANGISAQERAKIFRMASDFTISALAGRNTLYERFYLGSRPRALSGDHMREMAAGSFDHLERFTS